MKAVLERTAKEYITAASAASETNLFNKSSSQAAMVNSMMSVSDLHSHMQNTISQMRGDKTITETTASVSNGGGGIISMRRFGEGGTGAMNNYEVGEEDDELGLSQLASAVNQISAVQTHQHSVMTG